MNGGRDIFDWLRDQIQPSEPTSGATERARNRLQEAIDTEKATKRTQRTRRRLITWMASAAAIAIAIAVLSPLLVRVPARAALIEIAEVAREASPVDVPQGSFIYAESNGLSLVGREANEFGLGAGHVSYLLPTTRRVWKSPEDEFVMLEITNGQPMFFDPEAEAAYYSLGLDEDDRIGQTTREEFTGVIDPVDEIDWPSNKGDLLDSMNGYLGTDSPTTAEVVNLAANLLRERNPSPQLRAAILEVLADLRVDLIREDDETITIGITNSDRNQTFTFSRSGHLLAETASLIEGDSTSGIPPGAVTTRFEYEPIEVVATLPD